MSPLTRNNNTYILWLALAIIIGVALVLALQEDKPDTRLGRAAEEIGEGIDNAAREMKPESEKTVGEKIGGAVRDVGERIEDN